MFNSSIAIKESQMQPLPQGQYVKHLQYGLGEVTQSDAERTTIDFHLHGTKKFATRLMVVEVTDETSDRQAQKSAPPYSSLHHSSHWQVRETH